VPSGSFQAARSGQGATHLRLHLQEARHAAAAPENKTKQKSRTSSSSRARRPAPPRPWRGSGVKGQRTQRSRPSRLRASRPAQGRGRRSPSKRGVDSLAGQAGGRKWLQGRAGGVTCGGGMGQAGGRRLRNHVVFAELGLDDHLRTMVSAPEECERGLNRVALHAIRARASNVTGARGRKTTTPIIAVDAGAAETSRFGIPAGTEPET